MRFEWGLSLWIMSQIWTRIVTRMMWSLAFLGAICCPEFRALLIEYANLHCQPFALEVALKLMIPCPQREKDKHRMFLIHNQIDCLPVDINKCIGTTRVLQYVAVCCSVLQCVAVWCSVLQYVAMCYSALQYVAVCCSVTSTEDSET